MTSKSRQAALPVRERRGDSESEDSVMDSFRIYADESGTHSDQWLIIGMLFVPDHGPLHSALCKVKEEFSYFNRSPKTSARYKETHLTGFRSFRDVEVGKKWVDLFVAHSCYYRCVVVDWSIWNGKYFGTPFEPEALKKRRAYKKWAEMLLQPETRLPSGEPRFRNAEFYLDKLRILYGYDVLDHLQSRFTGEYKGVEPFISVYRHTDSWKDANQCLQLCDLLTGSLYQALVPAPRSPEKHAMCSYVGEVLGRQGVKSLSPSFWKQYAQNTLTQHFPKYSAWFWRPTNKKGRRSRS
jgi:hypothetical protein